LKFLTEAACLTKEVSLYLDPVSRIFLSKLFCFLMSLSYMKFTLIEFPSNTALN